MSVYAFYFRYVRLVMECGVNHLEFKLALCPFHNLVLLSTVNKLQLIIIYLLGQIRLHGKLWERKRV